MNVLVVVCNFDEKSFNHAIANVIKEEYLKRGYNVTYHDLYKEQFDPILTDSEYNELDINKITDEQLLKHCKELQESDIIAIIHPNWWGQPPALLKGWIDRVFRRGIAYKYTPEGKSVGLLKAKKAYVFNTSNTPEDIEKKVYGDPLENLWNTCMFGMCGIQEVYRLPIRGIVKSNEELRDIWLLEVRDFIK